MGFRYRLLSILVVFLVVIIIALRLDRVEGLQLGQTAQR